MASYSSHVNVMVKAAEKAGKNLLRDFGELEHLQMSVKGPGDFVTAADKRAEKIIMEELEKARPDYGFLMEEGGVKEGKDTSKRWIIDPIDGTNNFMRGIPHWCILIALEEDGVVTCGIVYDAVNNDLFWAEKGRGAYQRHQRLRVSGIKDPLLATIASGDNFNDHKGFNDFFDHFRHVDSTFGKTRCFGSMGLDLAYVAAGKLDGYWAPKFQPWDCAVGILMIREAGGFITTYDLNTDVINGENLIAGNEPMHKLLGKYFSGVASK